MDDEAIASAVRVHRHGPQPAVAVAGGVPQLLGQAVEVTEGVETHQHDLALLVQMALLVDSSPAGCVTAIVAASTALSKKS